MILVIKIDCPGYETKGEAPGKKMNNEFYKRLTISNNKNPKKTVIEVKPGA